MERNERCKCLLCKRERANKTGSHIVPSFPMKRINSHEGCFIFGGHHIAYIMDMFGTGLSGVFGLADAVGNDFGEDH